MMDAGPGVGASAQVGSAGLSSREPGAGPRSLAPARRWRDARAAVDVDRLADPAVLLDCLIALLEIDGTDVLLGEARLTAQKILRAVSEETSTSAFLTSRLRHKAPRVVTA